jgi:hypothetical protein
VRVLHAVRTPAFDGSKGIAERRLKQQLKLVAEHGVTMRGSASALFQMTTAALLIG